MIATLLAAESTAHRGREPGSPYAETARAFGNPVSDRIEAAAATPQQKIQPAALAPERVKATELASEQMANAESFDGPDRALSSPPTVSVPSTVA